MVYSISYEPSGSSYPKAKQVNGEISELELEDTSPDGGVGLNLARSFSGRRVIPSSVPKKIRWCSRRQLQDHEDVVKRTVSDRLRILVEEIEPEIHQFIPVEFVDNIGAHLAYRYFWQVCNRIDSVHHEKTNWILKNGVVWFPPADEKPHLVFDLSKVGDAKFWHDKHRTEGPYIIDEVRNRLEDGGITGIKYHYYEQA